MHSRFSQFMPRRNRTMGAVALALASLGVGVAHAENHALIMWIGDYGNPRNNLPGIDVDAANARKMARAMGVPDNNVREVNNSALVRSTIGQELSNMTQRIAKGDKVFLYYSGHGGQMDGRANGTKCTEGLIARDGKMYEDFLMQRALRELGAKASQVVFMNDSCFSGGAATKSYSRGVSDIVPKFYPDMNKVGSVMDDDYRCGEAINKMSRNLTAAAAEPEGPNVLYIAAADANEVAGATRSGSLATLAWVSCMKADSNNSGAVDGEELKSCAQQFVNNNRGNQTITLVGNSRLPLMFTGSSAGDTQAVRPEQTLEDIRASASQSYSIQMDASKQNLRIGQDKLEFSVTTNKPGYLYVLHVGSDGHTFDLLYPNKYDQNNHIDAGTHRLPDPMKWSVKVSGPAGTSHLLAIVSPSRKELSKDMDMRSAFPSTPTSAKSAQMLQKNLEPDGPTNGTATGGATNYGASNILRFNEQN